MPQRPSSLSDRDGAAAISARRNVVAAKAAASASVDSSGHSLRTGDGRGGRCARCCDRRRSCAYEDATIEFEFPGSDEEPAIKQLQHLLLQCVELLQSQPGHLGVICIAVEDVVVKLRREGQRASQQAVRAQGRHGDRIFVALGETVDVDDAEHVGFHAAVEELPQPLHVAGHAEPGQALAMEAGHLALGGGDRCHPLHGGDEPQNHLLPARADLHSLGDRVLLGVVARHTMHASLAGTLEPRGRQRRPSRPRRL
mmetsp:Transcript_130305/g.376970  ORF Transcript_130305/g.376970 Transcript_130305/m.376970 type:complete len:255 (+) Transcript_130305:202-966(+)